MILTSKTIVYALSLASLVCALLLVALYGTQAPFHTSAMSDSDTKIFTIDIDPSLISAKAAIVYDPITKQVLFEKSADRRLPLASLTKLMSADAVLASIDSNQAVQITGENLKPTGDSGFRVGEFWKLGDLIKFGLVASSNDAMAAAAATLGGDVVDRMNRRAKELGLTQTYFFNPTGLDLDVETAGAYGSVRDVAILAGAFLEQFPAQFEATASPSISISTTHHVLEATSTATPLMSIPGLIGAKTGYTDLAGGNLVAAFDIEIGRPLIVAVLGSTRDGRFDDVKLLMLEARKLFTDQN
ncbi:MAG: beta-lactamase [Parcubacteria group bacterium Gr01-1014_56]|nr:MAG: beta-lactamase [Parcubacteria group bacterium Gr01-1014_56]